MPDKNASAKMAYLHPLKLQFRKKKTYNIPNDRPLSKEYRTIFDFSVFHITGEIYNFKN